MARTDDSRIYRRKLSREDVRTGRVLIDKSRWRMFPPPGVAFTVVVGGQRFATRIDAEDCSCVLPPHQHYHLAAREFLGLLDLGAGATVTIEKLSDDTYSLS